MEESLPFFFFLVVKDEFHTVHCTVVLLTPRKKERKKDQNTHKNKIQTNTHTHTHIQGTSPFFLTLQVTGVYQHVQMWWEHTNLVRG